MKSTAQRILLLCFGLLITACVEYSHDPETIGPAKSEAPALFSDQAQPLVLVTRSVANEEKTFVVEWIQFNPLMARLWRPVGEGPYPAVLLLPAIWGDRAMERIARELVEEGFVCLQLSSGRYFQRLHQLSEMELPALAETIRLQVAEADQLLRWLSAQPTVDPDRIGILGMSIGAIIASLLTESDDHVQAAAYILGGGNLSEIMAAPQGYVKRRLRERIMSQNGMTQEEFQKAAAETLRPVDPLTFAGRLDPKRIFMVNGRFDKVIPYKNAKELWNALGRPDWVVIPTGHYTASFFMPYIRHRISQHFIQRLLTSRETP